MWYLRILVLCCAALLACSCDCISVYPLYTAEDAVYLPELEGNWRDTRSGGAHFRISKNDARSYLIESQDALGGYSESIAVAVRLNGELFLDVCPSERSASMAGSRVPFAPPVPMHYIYRIRQIEPTLIATAMNMGWVNELSEENPGTIPYGLYDPDQEEYSELSDEFRDVSSENVSLLFTPTEQLQQFFTEHLDTPGAWYDEADKDYGFSEFERYVENTELPDQKSIPLLEFSWRHQIGKNHIVSMEVTPRGKIVTSNDDGEITFFSPDGEVVAAHTLEGRSGFSRVSYVGDGQVIASGNCRVASFTEDGQYMWQTHLPGELMFGIGRLVDTVPGPDDLLYVTHCGIQSKPYASGEQRAPKDSAVVALTRGGEVDHAFLAHPGMGFRGTFGSDNLLYSSCSHQGGGASTSWIEAYSRDGELARVIETEGTALDISLSPGGQIIFHNKAGQLTALNADGSPAWSFDKPSGEPFNSVWTRNYYAIDQIGTVFCSSDYMLYAVSSDGAELWELDLGSQAGPPLLGPDGNIYCQANTPNRFQPRYRYSLPYEWSTYGSYFHSTLLFRVSPAGEVKNIWLFPEPVIIEGFGLEGEMYGVANALEYRPVEGMYQQQSNPELVRIDLP